MFSKLLKLNGRLKKGLKILPNNQFEPNHVSFWWKSWQPWLSGGASRSDHSFVIHTHSHTSVPQFMPNMYVPGFCLLRNMGYGLRVVVDL